MVLAAWLPGGRMEDLHESDVPESLHDIVGEVFRRYEEGLKRSNAMDFADLLLNTVRLLRRGEKSGAAWLLTRFRQVLVDEFQDTNKLQMDMVDLLASNGEVCVVGDDDQAIYSWRGADPSGMFRFAERPGVETVKLEENYRSTPSILDCANGVIVRNVRRLGKVLRPNKVGELVRVTRLDNERHEAQFVARKIVGPTWARYAVLYRTHAQSRALEEALRQRGIPYTIIGGLRFYDRAEIKDVLAYFRLAVNPRSETDLLRVANKPARGVGPKKVGALKTLSVTRGVGLYEALKDTGDEKIDGLLGVLEALGRARHACATPLDFFDAVMRTTGYRESLDRVAHRSRSLVQKEKARTRMDNVDELANDLSTYSSDHLGASVEDYLEHVALISSVDKDSGPVVSLMTIHAAKGLEFPHVFLVGFEEGLLPHANSIRESEETRDPSAIEEERRLAYVAITRAMDHLDVLMTRRRARMGRTEGAAPSRFFSDFPRGRFVGTAI